MMKRTVVLTVGTALAAVAMAPAAQAATTRDLYMVKDVQFTNGVYIGDFVALRKTGKQVVGAVGAFGSEYTCVRGTVREGRLRAAYYENGVIAGRFSRAWVGRGDTQRIKGMKSVRKAEARTYLESNPARFIRICEQQTSA